MATSWITLIIAMFLILIAKCYCAYIPTSLLNDFDQENALLEDQLITCPECSEQKNVIDNSKRVNIMGTWARSGMPLSILYLKPKPSNNLAHISQQQQLFKEQQYQHQKEELFNLAAAPQLPSHYRSNPSIRGFNSKMYAASLLKTKPVKTVHTEPLIGQPSLPIRRPSIVLPQLFVSYGFDNKKPLAEQK